MLIWLCISLKSIPPQIGESMNQFAKSSIKWEKTKGLAQFFLNFFALFATVSVHNWAIFKSCKNSLSKSTISWCISILYWWSYSSNRTPVKCETNELRHIYANEPLMSFHTLSLLYGNVTADVNSQKRRRSKKISNVSGRVGVKAITAIK